VARKDSLGGITREMGEVAFSTKFDTPKNQVLTCQERDPWEKVKAIYTPEN